MSTKLVAIPEMFPRLPISPPVNDMLYLPSQGSLQSGHLIKGLLNLYQLELAEVSLHTTGKTAAANLNIV